MKEGAKDSNLRPVEPPVKRDHFKFDKFESVNELKQLEAMDRNKDLLQGKASKADYEPYIPHFRTCDLKHSGMMIYFTSLLELLDDP